MYFGPHEMDKKSGKSRLLTSVFKPILFPITHIFYALFLEWTHDDVGHSFPELESEETRNNE